MNRRQFLKSAGLGAAGVVALGALAKSGYAAVGLDRPRLKGNVTLADDGWVIANGQRSISVNETGARVAMRLDGRNSFDDIAKEMVGEYKASLITLQSDVREFAGTLSRLGYL